MAHSMLLDTDAIVIVAGGVMDVHPAGPHAFLRAGRADDSERVTLWAKDGRKLAAALRRAAAEIDLATLKEVTRQP